MTNKHLLKMIGLIKTNAKFIHSLSKRLNKLENDSRPTK